MVVDASKSIVHRVCIARGTPKIIGCRCMSGLAYSTISLIDKSLAFLWVSYAGLAWFFVRGLRA
jgi:hypothetical protein